MPWLWAIFMHFRGPEALDDRIAELAKEDPKRQFYSIAHLITSGETV
jgi:hypothetical protein